MTPRQRLDEVTYIEFLAEWHEQMARDIRKLAGSLAEGLADSPISEQQSGQMPTATPVSRDRPLLTQQQLADRLGCNVRTLRRWVHEGRIPAPIRIGRAKRWDPDVIRELVRDGGDSALGRMSRERGCRGRPGRGGRR